MSIIDKIRKARETGVEAGGLKFTIRRPTDEEALLFSSDKVTLLTVVKNFTIGWNLTELDLIPGGSAEPVKFDPDLFAEWVADQPAVWEPLGEAVIQAYKSHTDKRDSSLKN